MGGHPRRGALGALRRGGSAAGLPWLRQAVALVFCAVLLTACASTPRIPYTQQEQTIADIPGIPGARFWADDPSLARNNPLDVPGRERPTMLALSGGGADGAFGAGLLTGWSQRGDRPQFTIVTGASAGALIAPFAFLGSGYDPVLSSVFTSGEMAGFLRFQGLSGLLGTSLFEAAPLRELIAKYVTPEVIASIADAYQRGRRLYIVTTNLDAQRTAIWDMGRIAASRDPRAPALFRQVIEASASIPGIFSPVLIDVAAQGRSFAEMHVDGGITSNVLVVPEAMLTNQSVQIRTKPRIYVILNSKLGPYFEVVPASTVQIAVRAFETSVRSNTRNTLLASYEFVRKRGWDMTLAAIDDSFPSQEKPGFDTAYMRGLFEFGVEQGRSGAAWRTGAGSDTPLPIRHRGPRVAAQ